jgi:hypothetical protein
MPVWRPREMTIDKPNITTELPPLSDVPQQRVPFSLIAWAEQTTDAALSTILNSTSPIFVFLLTSPITRHEAFTVRRCSESRRALPVSA